MASSPAAPDVRKSTPTYLAELKSIPPNFSTLLESYANVPKDAQIAHVLSLRNHAYASHKYPCLGRFRFMDLDLSNHPLYPEILKRLNSTDADELLLDFGCCIGQDVRKLLLDGAPVAKIYGSDLLPAFIDTGYELFNDKSTFPNDHFVAPADAFDSSPTNALARFDGKVGILYISAVFHLFLLPQQQVLARRCLKLLHRAPSTPNFILGGQTANVTAGEYRRGDGTMRWRHNGESWKEMWEDAAREETGCEVEVRSVLREGERDESSWGKEEFEQAKQMGFVEEGFRWMTWWVEVRWEG